MDLAPLNLAHYHERRSNRFLQRHRYDEAYKALETSLLYLQDAYKNARIPKTLEVLDTQKWDYERKLHQIKMRKQQHERMKHKEFVPLSEVKAHQALLVRQDSNVSAQSVDKSIDKTIRDFDAQLNTLRERNTYRLPSSKENRDPRSAEGSKKVMTLSEPLQQGTDGATGGSTEQEEFYSLVPLELPSFDCNEFTSASGSLASYASMAESFQK